MASGETRQSQFNDALPELDQRQLLIEFDGGKFQELLLSIDLLAALDAERDNAGRHGNVDARGFLGLEDGWHRHCRRPGDDEQREARSVMLAVVQKRFDFQILSRMVPH